jgi:hypothetical protein
MSWQHEVLELAFFGLFTFLNQLGGQLYDVVIQVQVVFLFFRIESMVLFLVFYLIQWP